MKIAFFDLEPWEQDYIRDRLSEHDLLLKEDSLTKDNVREAQEAEVLGVFIYSEVTAELLEKMPQLKLITTCSTGFDHIDLEACSQKGITVCNVPTYGENTVAEHTFALMLNLTRKIHKAYLKTTRGDFSLEGLRGIDLKGRTLGIVGLGHIGSHVARIAKGFEMNIVVYDPVLKSQDLEDQDLQLVQLDELLSSSDFISFHCPLNDSTRHLINKQNLSKCKKGVYIINTARGGVLETEALLEGLQSGQIAGAGLDVLEEEQCLIREEKEILSKHFDEECLRTTLENHALLHHPQVIITPHNAFNSLEALERIYQTTVENIQGFEAGKPINLVNA